MKTFKISKASARLVQSKTIYFAKSRHTLSLIFKSQNVKLIKSATKPLRTDLEKANINYVGNFYEVNGHALTDEQQSKMYQSDIIACFTGSTLFAYDHYNNNLTEKEIIKVTSSKLLELENKVFVALVVGDKYALIETSKIKSDKQFKHLFRISKYINEVEIPNVYYISHLDVNFEILGSWESRKFIPELTNYRMKTKVSE